MINLPPPPIEQLSISTTLFVIDGPFPTVYYDSASLLEQAVKSAVMEHSAEYNKNNLTLTLFDCRNASTSNDFPTITQSFSAETQV